MIASSLKLAAAALAISTLVLANVARAEGRLDAMRRLRTEAAAMVGRDDRAAVPLLREAHRLFPGGPGTLSELASAQARTGDLAGAVESLGRYARLGLTLDLSARQELADVLRRPDFAPVAALLAANAAPLGRMDWILPVAGAGPLEGVAVDPAAGRLFLSLVGGKSILVGSRKDGFHTLIAAGQAQAGVFGLAYDTARGALWATVASGPEIPASSGPPASALLRIDAKTGQILARYPAPAGEQLGDVALGPDGAVYASSGAAGVILRLRAGGQALEPYVRSPEMGSAQGMAIREGGRTLVVADYATGLHRVDIATGDIQPIAAPPSTALAGIDGLVAHGGRLYATQNGVTPERILRLTLSPDSRRVERVDTILVSGQADDVALAAAAGDTLVFSARSGWKPGGGQPVLGAISLE
jgi:streptogramin lyase